MKISYNWLQEYFEKKLPSPKELGETLSLKAFEVEEIEERGDDSILDIDIGPNRAHDSLSYIGIAKEIAVLFDIPLKLPKVNYKKGKEKSSDYISLKVDDPQLVPRAMKRVVLDVRVEESPDWLKKRLISMDQKPINNIVDITNFVMWETGQPVHAFDLDKIIKGEIVIRGAHENEKITTLDNMEYVLKKGMLVIADSEKPLDIAGIKGGISSRIDKNTKRIVLSVCSFDQTWIRDTSVALKLRTEASWRFQNGISTIMPEMAMERLSQLVSEVVEGDVLEEILDNYPRDMVRTSAPYKIGVSLEEVNRVLGSNMKDKDVTDILDRLTKYAGFKWEKVSPLKKILEEAKKYEGVPYRYGASITFDAPNYFDCSSFVSFVFINAGIALPRRTVDQFVYGEEVKNLSPGDIVFSLTSETKEEVERLGTTQRTTYTKSIEFLKDTKVSELSHNGIYLGDGKVVHASGKWHKGKVVIENLKNSPAFKNIVGYRRVLLNDNDRYVVEIPHERLDLRAGPGYLISGNKEDLIEEIGRVYGYTNIKSVLPKDFSFKPKVNKLFYYVELIKDILIENGFSEVITYSFQNEGKVKLANPLSNDKKYLRNSLIAGLGESFELNIKNLPLFGTDKIKIFEIGKVFSKDKEEMHLGIALNNKEDFVTIVDLLEKKLGQKLEGNISNSVWEINLETLIKKLPGVESYSDLSEDLSQIKQFIHISPYPYILRDVSVWVSKDTDSHKVRNVIIKAAVSKVALLKVINMFDHYSKENRVSYAFHLTFQSNKKTLIEKEVNDVMKEIESAFKQNGWDVR